MVVWTWEPFVKGKPMEEENYFSFSQLFNEIIHSLCLLLSTSHFSFLGCNNSPHYKGSKYLSLVFYIFDMDWSSLHLYYRTKFWLYYNGHLCNAFYKIFFIYLGLIESLFAHDMLCFLCYSKIESLVRGL